MGSERMLSYNEEIILIPDKELRNPLINIDNYKLLEDKPEKVYNPQEYYPGTIKITSEGYAIELLAYNNKYDVIIRFIYNGFIMHCGMSAFVSGSIKNPFHINAYGGYFGAGPFTKRSNLKAYSTWYKILIRLDKKNQINNSRNRSYATCTICDEWRNFQIFAHWYESYFKLLNPSLEYNIDKDILQWNQKYKIYSPQTCCLIPVEINMCLINISNGNETGLPLGVRPNSNNYCTFINTSDKPMMYLGTYTTPMEAFEVYKNAKKAYIAKLANEYYSINGITKDIYDKLINIEILPY